MMKKPTPAQLAARKLFAERAKAGTLKKRRTNPTKIDAGFRAQYVASQYKGKYPRRIKTVSSNGNVSGVVVKLNNGELYTLTAKECHGILPRPGEDISKYENNPIKLFAERAKAGTLKRGGAKRKTNPTGGTRKLHVKRGGEWLPVFCEQGGRVITCENEPSKALPPKAMWAEDDLRHFQNHYANHEFALMPIARKKNPAPKRPKAAKLYTVHKADVHGNPVYHIAHFRKLADAKQYAQAYADLHKTRVAITSKKL